MLKDYNENSMFGVIGLLVIGFGAFFPRFRKFLGFMALLCIAAAIGGYGIYFALGGDMNNMKPSNYDNYHNLRVSCGIVGLIGFGLGAFFVPMWIAATFWAWVGGKVNERFNELAAEDEDEDEEEYTPMPQPSRIRNRPGNARIEPRF